GKGSGAGRILRRRRGTSTKPRTRTIARYGTQSPNLTYRVIALEDRIVPRRIPVWNKPNRWVTRPLGSMNALIPETAAFTTHLPVSTARMRLICSCWADAAVNPYDALFTVTTRNCAPSRTKVRGSWGNAFSKQIGVPNGGRPWVDSVWMRSPGARSTGICRSAWNHESSWRQGTYSPKGTR